MSTGVHRSDDPAGSIVYGYRYGSHPIFELLVDHTPSATAGALDLRPQPVPIDNRPLGQPRERCLLEIAGQLIIRKGTKEYATH